jgi:ABC-2 type transport system ATP-binding protein
MINVSNFHKAYDRHIAVRGLTFCVQPGQILGLVGPNGAGKTSTLRALTGIIPASRGTLEICSYPIDEQPMAAKQCLGFIPDDPQLFQDLTVQEHMSFFAAAYQVQHWETESDRLLQQFQLDAKRHVLARDLSRGMRQKLAICCAYLHAPRAILFDEPMTGLDPHGIRTLKNSITQRARQQAAVIVSSHLLAMVEDICTHVLILEGGAQRFCGPIGQLRNEYASTEQSSTLEDIYFRATNADDRTEATV